eukprot:TRINITY_DN2849_c0_g1_i2.p1 TRINITY_DN2849_c0_g1~~TRINITY_DN2849_c0_g1_i2.p1  ORF type:complete len:142 (+),score=39.18 TRINITY_DN2849_c0_g1_i2:127-552(+)
MEQLLEGDSQFYVNEIATPMANEKNHKKILRLTKKMLKAKLVKRGVKEVVKAIRKKTKGICILAGDVSPIDVISHFPVLCEKNHIPYIFVRSRMELGIAAQTKRPTSVVLLVTPDEDEQEKLFAKHSALSQKILSNHPFMS